MPPVDPTQTAETPSRGSGETSPFAPPTVPHSGNLGLEQPVRVFDNTPLADAVDAGLVITPSSPATLAPAPPIMPPTETSPVDTDPQPQRRKAGKIGAVIGAGAVVLAGGIFALRGGDDTSETKPSTVPTVSVETTQPTQSTTVETVPSNEILALSADMFYTGPLETEEDFAALLDKNEEVFYAIYNNNAPQLIGAILSEDFSNRYPETITRIANKAQEIENYKQSKGLTTEQYWYAELNELIPGTMTIYNDGTVTAQVKNSVLSSTDQGENGTITLTMQRETITYTDASGGQHSIEAWVEKDGSRNN